MKKKFNEIRLEILKEIFNNIDINIDTEKFSSLKYLITNLIENTKIFDNAKQKQYFSADSETNPYFCRRFQKARSLSLSKGRFLQVLFLSCF